MSVTSACPLTPTQVDLIQRLTDGTGRKTVASDMGISIVTVYQHMKNARHRAGAATDFELIAEAVREGWVQ